MGRKRGRTASASSAPEPKRSHVRDDDEKIVDDSSEGEEPYTPYPRPGRFYQPKPGPFYQSRPDYLKAYQHVQDRLRELVGTPKHDVSSTEYTHGLIGDFAENWFKFATFSDDEDEILERLLDMNVSAALIVGCVADGGPRGVSGWLELFTDTLERQSLVCAIIGLVLQEHVFSSLCYGATPEQLRELHEEVDLQYRAYPDDGFTRAQHRYIKIKQILADAAKDANNPHGLPAAFLPTSQRLAWQLYHLLEPIARLDEDWQPRSDPPSSRTKQLYGPKVARGEKHAGDDAQQRMVHELFAVVCRAGLLALHTRLDKEVVYHMQPAYKDEFWNEDEMRAFNRARMVQTNPTKRDCGGDAAKVARTARLLALVRQTVFPGWKAYRKGGWREGDKGRGIRECELERAWVGLRWGLQRRWESQEEAKLREGAEKKGKERARAGSGATEVEEKDRDVGFKEWLTIWADENDAKKELDLVKGWFSFSNVKDDVISEGEETDDSGILKVYD